MLFCHGTVSVHYSPKWMATTIPASAVIGQRCSGQRRTCLIIQFMNSRIFLTIPKENYCSQSPPWLLTAPYDEIVEGVDKTGIVYDIFLKLVAAYVTKLLRSLKLHSLIPECPDYLYAIGTKSYRWSNNSDWSAGGYSPKIFLLFFWELCGYFINHFSYI